MASNQVRVRFAPSPTGFLHVGGARTALFNFLFAKKLKGTFVLRIEDTDEMRSSDQSTLQIFESMKWLGLSWDEGPDPEDPAKSKGPHAPYFQMQRVDLYRKHAEELKAKGVLYECYCSEEELDADRKHAMLEKRPPRYSKRCRHLTDEQKAKAQAQGRKAVYRFAVPTDQEVAFDDIVRERVVFPADQLEDFIVIKSSGGPTYNFCCVVDDHLMEISHVIRGDDHISNTPKQVLLYKAFGWQPPKFAHISMILGADGSRLSKRHGATGVMDFREQGYLPYAVVNYLALLGFATTDSQDIFDTDKGWDMLVEKFELERCQKSPAVFDYTKLTWMNGIYIRRLSKDQLLDAVRPYLTGAAAPVSQLKEFVALEQEKYQLLSDAPKLLDFFFTETYAYRWEELKALKIEGLEQVYQELEAECAKLVDFSCAAIEQMLKGLAKRLGKKNAHVFHPLRFAVSGRLQGPSLFHMAEALGKDKVISRLKRLALERVAAGIS
ncbi:MAG: glutamate--tRNA ligase [Elusimicrobiota bacterium]|mgnify:CR=1 FL=1